MLWAMDIYLAMLEIGMKQETPLFLLIFKIFPSFVIFLDFDISKNYLVITELEKVLWYMVEDTIVPSNSQKAPFSHSFFFPFPLSNFHC